MPTSKKTRSTKPVKTTDWHQISTPMLGEHSQLVSRQPVVKRAALARPGQLVTTTAGCGALAIIEVCTPDLCVVRFVRVAPVIPCYWCGKATKPNRFRGDRRRELDHIKPLIKKGPDCVHNLCVSCGQCNARKSTKMPEQFTGQFHLEFVG